MNRVQLGILLFIAVVAMAVLAMRSRKARESSPAADASPTGAPLGGTDVPLPQTLETHRAKLESALAPAVRLAPGGAPVARLGGKPRLPAGMAWPASPAHPMSFVAEVDLAALHRAAPEVAPLLPHDGRLALFYDVEEMRWGFDPKDGAFVKLLHLPAGGEDRIAPAGATVFKERVLGGKLVRVLPEADELPADVHLGGGADEAYFEHAAGLAPEPDHRIGGHAAWIQNDDREEAAIASAGGSTGTPEQAREARAKLSPGPASEWKLLWQIDSDDAAGFMWGDAGRLYLLARDDDLQARRFDRVWLVLQCY